jgi:hypothetical protein
MLKVLPAKIANKALPITGQVFLFILLVSLVGGIKILLRTSEIKSTQTSLPPPPIPVAVPRYFEEYTEVMTLADKMISENPVAFRDLSEISLTNIQGAFQMPLKKPVIYHQLRLPGDFRAYRNDVHQGTDIYGVAWEEKIYPVASGIILRIDKNYVPMTKAARDKMLDLTKTRWHGTPGSLTIPVVEEPYGNVLDKLRGRQVWVYHGKNKSREPILTMYAHLAEVNNDLNVYDGVDINKVIGYVGNSGTSGEVEHNKWKEVHLHFEIFIGDRYWTPKKDLEIGRAQNVARYQELQETVLRLIPSQY